MRPLPEPELPDLAKQGVRTRFIGRRDRAPLELQEKMAALEHETAGRDRLNLWIAFDYGGRAELVEAARRLVESGIEPEEVDENALAANLYAPELPDPDLLIRTSGELRVSNFLLWQIAYSELVFVDKLWPDFGPRDLQDALGAYARRSRLPRAARVLPDDATAQTARDRGLCRSAPDPLRAPARRTRVGDRRRRR